MIRIEAARLLPGRGDPIDDGVVLLDDGTIRYAGPRVDAPRVDVPRADVLRDDHGAGGAGGSGAGDRSAGDGVAAEVVQVDTVMPGMWDCHVHLFGTRSASPSYVFAEPIALRAARATVDLAAALRAGFTSVREAGGLGIHLAAAVAEGSIPGPWVYAAGAALSVTGGHTDLHALPPAWVRDLSRWEPSVRVCDGVTGVVEAVREQLRAGAEVIKICASGGVISERNDPRHQHFTRAELEAIVEVAGLADRSVMAHCHGTAAMLAAVDAGVRTIEHGSYIDDEVAAAMRERGTLLVPTRLIGCEFLEDADSLPPEMATKMRAVYEDSGERIARAAASGVRIAMGTDVLLSGPDLPAGWGNHGRELSLLVELGLTPLQAIEAATANAPDTLGLRAPRSGQLLAGYDADVIAVRGDPTRDVGVLADPAAVTHVWQGGRLVG